MPYFYNWDSTRHKLHSHSGEFEYSAGEYHFETNDGSGKRYLHCKPDGTTYNRTQVVLDEKDDLLAIEILISKAEDSLRREDSLVTQASLNSLDAMMEFRDKLKGRSEGGKGIMGCEFCTTDTDNREMISEYSINLGLFGTQHVYTYISDKDFLATSATLDNSTSEEDFGWIKKRIKYCPMCGRKLREEG